MESAETPREKRALRAQIERSLKEKDPNLLKRLSANEKNKLIETVAVTVTKEHSGPLPSPETLLQYNDAVPNGADRIMTIFEEQARHRMALEAKVVGRQTFQSQLGQWFALAIGVTTIGCGTYCIMADHDAAGLGLASSGLITLAVAFLKGRKSQKEDLENKSPSAVQKKTN